jgi:hypothetical protein
MAETVLFWVKTGCKRGIHGTYMDYISIKGVKGAWGRFMVVHSLPHTRGYKMYCWGFVGLLIRGYGMRLPLAGKTSLRMPPITDGTTGHVRTIFAH